MESLTEPGNILNTARPTDGVPSESAVSNDTLGVARISRAQDRVTLGKAEVETIEAWLKQINDSTRGYLTLTRSDVVNYLVKSHKAELSTKELSQIRDEHYDPVKHLAWIAPLIKAALADGNHERVQELERELRCVTLGKRTLASATDAKSAVDLRSAPRKRKLKKPAAAESKGDAMG